MFHGLLTASAIVATGCSSPAATIAPSPSSTPTEVPVTPAASPSGTAGSERSTAEPATAEPTEPATAEPSPTASPSPAATPDRHADRELEAALPSAYQGVTLQKLSTRLSDMGGISSQGNKAFETLIEAFGRTTADVTVADGLDPKVKVDVVFSAYRIKGVAASTWWPPYRKILAKGSPGIVLKDVTLGGKVVTQVIYPTGTRILYMWPGDRFLYAVITHTEAEADDAIAAVP